MYPLVEIGSLEIPTYGVFSVLALLAGILLTRRYARIEGRDPSQTTDALVLTAAVAVAGARGFELLFHWQHYTASADALRSLLHSTGTFYGAVITAIPFAIYWFRRIGLPMLKGLDLLALVGAVALGVGRWGCFASGCCWGTPTGLPWAVSFPDAARLRHAGLPDVPLHPTQIYSSLASLAILGILILAYRRKRFHGQICATYLVLYSLTRFSLENLRGDASRGFVFGGLLSTSQAIGILLAVIGAGAWVLLDRRHRQSGESDWQPAPTMVPAAERTRR